MKLTIYSLVIIYLSCVLQSNVEAANILAAFPLPGKSHSIMTNTIIKELINRGHKITMITGLTLAPLKLGSNFTEVLIQPEYDFWSSLKKLFNAETILDMIDLNVFQFMKMVEVVGTETTVHALEQSNIQTIINAEKTEGVYDLLLIEQFFNEPFLALAHKYKLPIITVSTFGQSNYMSQMMGIVTPWSYVPHTYLPYTDHMTLYERIINTFTCLYDDLYREYIYFPKMDQIVEKYFKNTPNIPKISQLEKSIDVMLLNNYAPLSTVRPKTDAMVFVGGLHIYPSKSLPADIQKFIDDAPNGVIYFSLGTQVQSKDMPPEKMQMFLEVFSKLKERIIWKFEDETIPNMPKNLLIKKWLPQGDILAHPKVKVFITHGGLLGTQEGVYNAVPMLGIPIYCDQHLNMLKAEQGGYAISLHYRKINKNLFENALNELLNNPKYTQNVQRVSAIFRDRPLDARETAIYWIEYVIRHKGAAHFRSASHDLSWYQLYLLDITAIIIVAILLIYRFFTNDTKKITKKHKKN